MNEKDMPQEIDTVAKLILWPQWYEEHYGPGLLLDVRYDSGYGRGYFVPSAFQIDDNKTLRMDLS